MLPFALLDNTFTNIGDSFNSAFGNIVSFIFNGLLPAAILLLIGYIVARVVRTVLTAALRAIKFDQITDRAGIGKFLQQTGTNLDAAAVLAALVFWFVFLIFLQLAVNALGLIQITVFITQVLDYIPNVVVAIAIIIIGALLANIGSNLARGAASEAGLKTAGLIASVARYAILGFAIVAALTQLHIAEGIIQILFAGLVAMLALAGGLAFGLGGVDSARSLLASQAMGSTLQAGQKVQIGDQTGTVVRHDLNSTVLKTAEGQVSIPNGSLSKDRVTLLS